MRICMMIALILIGSHIQMPWYYWTVLCIDFGVIFVKAIYKAGKRASIQNETGTEKSDYNSTK